MSKQIQEFVAENRDTTSRINSTLVQLNSRRRRNLAFAQNQFIFDVEVEVEQRELNDTLISGHPNAKHGAGRGKGGEQRSRWNEKVVVNTTSEFAPTGRTLVAQALNGGQISNRMKIGIVGNTEGELPTTINVTSDMDNIAGISFGWTNEGEEPNSTTFTNQTLFPTDGSIDSLGVYSLSAALYAVAGFEPFESPSEEELRFTMDFTVTGDTPGEAVITDEGERIVAKSIRSSSTPIGLQEVVFGSGESQPQESDTALENEEFSELGEREIGGESISVRAIIPEGEPTSQPVDINEIGIATNDGVLVWRATTTSIEKTDELSLTARAGFRVR